MTIYILDVSQFQKGLDLASAKRQGYSGVIAKCTEGHGYADSQYLVFKAAAQKADLPFAAYHFLHSDSAASAQAANLAHRIGDKSIPVWIDCEPTGKSKPNIAHVTSFAAECKKLGLKVVGLYYPGWYWGQSGKPKLPASLGFWQSGYPSSKWDYGSSLYPGDKHRVWGAVQGGLVPDLWQFASTCKLSGYLDKVDVSAFRGSAAQLVETGFLKDWTPAPRPPAPKPPVPPVPPTPPVPPPPPTPHPAGGLTPEELDQVATSVASKLKVTT